VIGLEMILFGDGVMSPSAFTTKTDAGDTSAVV